MAWISNSWRLVSFTPRITRITDAILGAMASEKPWPPKKIFIQKVHIHQSSRKLSFKGKNPPSYWLFQEDFDISNTGYLHGKMLIWKKSNNLITHGYVLGIASPDWFMGHSTMFNSPHLSWLQDNPCSSSFWPNWFPSCTRRNPRSRGPAIHKSRKDHHGRLSQKLRASIMVPKMNEKNNFSKIVWNFLRLHSIKKGNMQHQMNTKVQGLVETQHPSLMPRPKWINQVRPGHWPLESGELSRLGFHQPVTCEPAGHLLKAHSKRGSKDLLTLSRNRDLSVQSFPNLLRRWQSSCRWRVPFWKAMKLEGWHHLGLSNVFPGDCGTRRIFLGVAFITFGVIKIIDYASCHKLRRKQLCYKRIEKQWMTKPPSW